MSYTRDNNTYKFGGPLGPLLDLLHDARKVRTQEKRDEIENEIVKLLSSKTVFGGYKQKLVEYTTKMAEKYEYVQQPIQMAAEIGLPKAVQKLIDRGANKNTQKTDYDWPPFFLALRKGHLETLKVLIKNGAEIKDVKIYEYDFDNFVTPLVSVLHCCNDILNDDILSYYVKHIDPDEIEESIKILEKYYKTYTNANQDGKAAIKTRLKEAEKLLLKEIGPTRSTKRTAMEEFATARKYAPPGTLMSRGPNAGVGYREAEESWKKHLKGGRTRRLRRDRS
jgi:hypothetical protein